MKNDPMLEALRRNRAQSFDITISVTPQGGEEEIGPSEGLMSDDESVEHELNEGEGEADSIVGDAEAQRRELNLAPVAENFSGDLPPGAKAEQSADQQMVQDELAKTNFGKGSLTARKQRELSANKV